MSKAVERFVAAAADLGFEPQVTRYPAGTRTARAAAAAVGCQLAQIVKSLVFVVGDQVVDQVVVALVSGANRVDTERLAAAVGMSGARQAQPDEVAEATGFAVGGVPPFGHTRRLQTILDPTLLDFEQVWAAAGTPDACFCISPGELARITDATVAQIVTGAVSTSTTS